MGSFFANLRCGWIDSCPWRNILGSKGHAVSTTAFACMSGAAAENPKPTKPCLIRTSNNDSWFDLRRQLCRIAASTCRACRARSNSLSPEGRNRIRDPIRASQLARCFSLRARAPRQFVSTPLGKAGGRDDFDGLFTQWKPLRRRILPSRRMNVESRLCGCHPHFCVGHPL